jgi:multiple sugar transport system permease protein
MTIQQQLKRGKVLRAVKDHLFAGSMLAPYLIIFGFFFIFPFIYGLMISLYDWNLFYPDETVFVGLSNFATILFNEESIFYTYFWRGFTNTLLFVVISVPLLILIPLFFAILIDNQPKGYKWFRTILFMPTVLSISSVILVWKWQFYNNGGFINALLVSIGLQEIPFLVAQPWAWISVLIVTVWWTMGTNMVILGAGLKNVDKSMYEAAAIDGATYRQTLRYITLPALGPQMFIVAITTTLASFGIFGQTDLLTNGGPDFTTQVLMMVIRPLAFGPNARPGIATSMAIMMGLVMITISIIQARYIRSKGDN